MSVPNWLRIVLLLPTLASFLPQLWRLFARRDSSGISLWHVLFNLIVATELFTISLFLVVNNRCEGAFVFVHDPPDFGDHINLAQFALVWILWLVIFTACLVFRTSYSACQHALVLNIYVVFLLMSVVPLVIDAAINDPYEPHGGHVGGGMPETFHQMCLLVFSGVHMFFINPVINLLGFAAFLAQALTTFLRPRGSGPGALSLRGLAAQAVVFGVLAPLWHWRLVFPYEEEGGHVFSAPFSWLLLVGYVPLDYALFAIAQAGLLWLAVRHGRRRSSPNAPADETDPLLREETRVGGAQVYT